MSSVIGELCLKSACEFGKLTQEETINMLKITTYPLGPIQTNCYLIQDEQNNCLVIDPGEEGLHLIKKIEEKSLRPVAILLTHGHFDHIGAVDIVRDHFGIPVYIHENEQNTLTNPEENGSTRYPGLPLVQNRKADQFLKEEGMLEIGPFSMEVRHTPGHSTGSVSFIFEADQLAIVGDTLFRESIGRTDLPGGHTETLLSSIQNKLLTLDGAYTIYPGHGMPTTTTYEKERNPFLR